MQLIHISADIGEVSPEYAAPIEICKIFIIEQRFGGDIAILTDIADDLVDVLVLKGIQGTVVQELRELLFGQLPIHTDDGADEGSHAVAANHLLAVDVLLILFLRT